MKTKTGMCKGSTTERINKQEQNNGKPFATENPEAGGFLCFGGLKSGCKYRSFILINDLFHYLLMGLTSAARSISLLWFVTLALFVTVLPAVSTELPLSVAPSVVNTGQTVTVTGGGFQSGARGLVWGGGPYISGSVDTPDSALDVVVYGDYAYVADGGSGLQVIDIQSPAAPMIVGSVDTPGSAEGVTVSGSYAYVADGNSGLQIIDISDPAVPVIVGGVDTGGADTSSSAKSVAVSGNYAYVVDYGYVGSSGLQIIDISNPATPTIVANVNTLSSVKDVIVSGSYAYVVALSGLYIIDISAPTSPVIIGSANVLTAVEVVVSGNYAYVTALYSGLQVIDISNPAVPTVVGSIDMTAVGVAVSGNYAYVTESGRTHVVDISDPAALVMMRNVDTSDAQAVAISGNHAYVADGYSGLKVINIRNPAAAIMGSVNTVDRASAVVVSDNYAYIADGSNRGMRIIDISDPADPTIVGSSFSSYPGYAQGVAVSGNYAYLADSSGLLVIDVSDPATPLVVRDVDAGVPKNVVVSGNHAYVADASFISGLRIIDITDPASAVIVGSVDTPGYGEIADVAVSGGYAYVADSSYGLLVIDVSNPSTPTIVGSVDTPGTASGVVVSGNYAYVADRRSGLQVIDIGNPAAPVIVGYVDTPDSSYSDVAISGKYVYVANISSMRGVQVIDVSNPAAPAIVGDVTTSGARGASVSGNYVYVADGDSGVKVLTRAIPSIINWVSSTTLELTVPTDLPPGTYDVTVLNPDGTVYKARNALTISDSTTTPDKDSDGDGMSDDYEITNGLNPNDPGDAVGDADKDGLTNFQEYAFGTNLYVVDSDGDGVGDFNEIALGSNPLDINEKLPIPDEMSPPEGGSLHPIFNVGGGSILENVIRANQPTIVLTHGLSEIDDFDGAPDSLWTGYKNPKTREIDFQKATSLIISKTSNVNIIRYVWNGAFKVTGALKKIPIPDRLEYYQAWKQVPGAGAELAKQLLERLGNNYSQPIHFIGHSLGTAVNAYAANLFLRNATKVTKAQFTALDRPHLVNKIVPQLSLKESDPEFQGLPADERFFLMSFNKSNLFQERYGYNADFFPSLLQDIRSDGPSLELFIDNYYAESIEAVSFSGVGGSSNGVVYNHRSLVNPNDINDPIFNREVISNDHSSVHQWYRWTIAPDNPGFLSRYKDYFTIIKKDWEAKFATTFCNGENLMDIGGVSRNFDSSLNPCQKGWHWSLNGPDPNAFSSLNIGEPISVRKATLFLEPEEVYGCYMVGGVIRCREQSSPFLIAKIEIPEGSEFLSFEYRFVNTGDGDYAVVLLDDSPVWTVPGSAFSGEEFVESGPIQISGITGSHKLTIILYGVGEKNAELEVQNLSLASVSVSVDSEVSHPTEASEETDTTEGTPTGGGGGGCTINRDARVDPVLPLLMFWSLFYLIRRRSGTK